ncbi:MAG: ATP-binding protein [Candidatus Heimdallarchaeota archaeon]|nr:ATP-binding protein [Candidatus Heimdallarchaeota archaeon]
MSAQNSSISYTDRAIEAEETIKAGISSGDPVKFIQGFYDYEKVILYYEGVGKSNESRKLLTRLEKILNIVVEKGNPDAQYYSKLGPFFILYARHFNARILEMLNLDLKTAVASRALALDFAIGIEWVEQVLNIMVDLLIEGLVDHCLRYLKFTQEKKEDLIEEIKIQIEETSEKRKFWQKKDDPATIAKVIYESFLRLLGLMIEKFNKGQSFLDEGLEILRQIKNYANADLEYLDLRFIALESNIFASSREEINVATISHIKSRIIPFTIMDDPNIEEVERLLERFVRQKGIDIDVSIAQIPILGANPSGTPHLSIIGQTGTGKTTLTKQILKENIRAQDCAVVVFDHHFEYADLADHVVQIGGERQPEASAYFGVEEIGDTFKQAQSFIQDQQKVFASEGSNPEELAKKIRNYEAETRPTINRFVIDTIEGVISKDEKTALPIKAGEITVFWVIMDEADIATTIISTFIKYILQQAIHEELPTKTIMVTEEAQRLRDDQWVKNLASEGRKFGLFLISISQSPEFNPWVVSNSELTIFKLRQITDKGPIAELFNEEAKKMVINLDVGEYLNYHRDKRNWVLSYNPEALSPFHAKQTLDQKVKQLREIVR